MSLGAGQDLKLELLLLGGASPQLLCTVFSESSFAAAAAVVVVVAHDGRTRARPLPPPPTALLGASIIIARDETGMPFCRSPPRLLLVAADAFKYPSSKEEEKEKEGTSFGVVLLRTKGLGLRVKG